MKTVKIIVIVVGVIFIISLIGVVVFIRTFDPNTYKERIAQQLGRVLQTDVGVGYIDFEFSIKNGLILDVHNVVLASKGLMKGIGVEIEEIQLAVNLEKLVRQRTVVVEAVNLREPIIRLDLTVEKSRVQSPDPKSLENNITKVPENSKQRKTSSRGFFEQMQVKAITVSGGEIYVLADGRSLARDLEIKDVDARIENLVFNSETQTTTSPFSFLVDCDVFNVKDILTLRGLGRIDVASQQVRFDDVEVKSFVTRAALDTMREIFPDLKKSGLSNLEGVFEATVTQMIFSPKELAVFTCHGAFQNWRVAVAALPADIKNFNMAFDYSGSNLDIHKSGFEIADGQVNFSGRVEDVFKTQMYSLETKFEDIDIAPFANQLSKGITIEGKIHGEGAFQGAGFLLPDLLKDLKGDANIVMAEGKINGFNVLNFIFQKISIIPDLGSRFEQALPEKYRRKLHENYTLIKQASAKLELAHGVVFYNTEVAADVASLDAQGSLDLKLMFAWNGNLRINAPLSQALIDGAEEFSTLKDAANGEIVVPLKEYRGPLMAFRPFPDKDYLLQNVVGTKLKEEAKDFILNAIGVERPAGDGSQEGSPDTPKKNKTVEEDIVDTIFDSIFK